MTREQIDKLRGDLHEHFYAETDFMDKIDALCDLALQSLSQESVRSEALELLDGWQKVLEVDTPSEGLCEGKFTLWHVHGTHRHVLTIARNSYDDAALNTVLGLLEATRAILQKDVHSTELRK